MPRVLLRKRPARWSGGQCLPSPGGLGLPTEGRQARIANRDRRFQDAVGVALDRDGLDERGELDERARGGQRSEGAATHRRRVVSAVRQADKELARGASLSPRDHGLMRGRTGQIRCKRALAVVDEALDKLLGIAGQIGDLSLIHI